MESMNVDQVVNLLSLRPMVIMSKHDDQLGLVEMIEGKVNVEFITDLDGGKVMEYKGMTERSAKFLLEGLAILRGYKFVKVQTAQNYFNDIMGSW